MGRTHPHAHLRLSWFGEQEEPDASDASGLGKKNPILTSTLIHSNHGPSTASNGNELPTIESLPETGEEPEPELTCLDSIDSITQSNKSQRAHSTALDRVRSDQFW